MTLPFSRSEFLAVFTAYNEAFWPLQLFYFAAGLFVTHPYPATPLFGVAPCPTTLFTIGLLILARYPRPVVIALVPLAWSVIGGSAAILLGVPEDWALFGALVAWTGLAPGESRTWRL